MTSALDELAAPVAAAHWPDLLPGHRADGDDQPVGGPSLLDALPLGDGHVLLVVADGSGRIYPVPVLREGSALRRARPGDGAASAAVARLGRPGRHGRFGVTAWHLREAEGESPIDVDQTNESVVVGGAAVVKWSLLADPGPHPAPSLMEALATAGFAGTPRPWGAVEWVAPGESQPRLLALVTEYVQGAVDGWTWAVDLVREAAASGESAPVVTAGGAVGGLVASFHRALVGTTSQQAFDPSAWRVAALADLQRAIDVSAGRAREVLDRHADEVRGVLGALTVESRSGIRVHGDLHVGQVLRAERAGTRGYLLTDFEGNPVAPPDERVGAQPAALDVAGLAQSIVHAGLVVRRHHPQVDAVLVAAAAEQMRQSFLEAYRTGLGEHRDLLDARLLRPFALRQICREFIYAAAHLPRWSYVPEAALPLALTGSTA